jgi:hypothetical protein
MSLAKREAGSNFVFGWAVYEPPKPTLPRISLEDDERVARFLSNSAAPAASFATTAVGSGLLGPEFET